MHERPVLTNSHNFFHVHTIAALWYLITDIFSCNPTKHHHVSYHKITYLMLSTTL